VYHFLQISRDSDGVFTLLVDTQHPPICKLANANGYAKYFMRSAFIGNDDAPFLHSRRLANRARSFLPKIPLPARFCLFDTEHSKSKVDHGVAVNAGGIKEPVKPGRQPSSHVKRNRGQGSPFASLLGRWEGFGDGEELTRA
jgi:hypothetical protein